MSKPIVNPVSTFDANFEYTFSFRYDGDQPYKNRMLITKSSTNEIVYDNTITSMKYIHVLSANTIQTNIYYCVQFSVFDINDNESELSDKVLFICYDNPKLYFKGLSTTTQNNINGATLQTDLTYSQLQNRAIKEYRFYLYDSTKMNILQESDLIKDNSLSYTFRFMESDRIYYIRCDGMTVDNVYVDTGFIKLYVSFSVSNSYNSFHAVCDNNGGYTQLSTNIVSIDGIPYGDYILENGLVRLHNSFIKYTEGFIIDGDFKISFSGKNFDDNSNIIKFSNGLNNIELNYFRYEQLNYFRLSVSNGYNEYVLYSNRFTVSQNQYINIYLKRISGYWQLDIVPIS